MAGSPLSPGAFYDFAAKIPCSTSSIIKGGIDTGLAVAIVLHPLSSLVLEEGTQTTVPPLVRFCL